MSGPYAAGLGKRKVDNYGDTSSSDENSDFFFSGHNQSRKVRRRHVTPTDAEIIPKYRPEDIDSNVIGWLHKIDQLGDIYGWDDTDRIFIMQLRLRGSARDWYDDLESYDMSWESWKQTLQIAFPRSSDYVDKLGRMLARTKEDEETMTKYYHDKLSLLKKCKIEGQNAVSCIIRGLPVELRANAKAYKCETPEQLYYGYLSVLGDVKKTNQSTLLQKSTWRRGNGTPKNTSTQYPLQPKICYLCRRSGHESKDCRQQLHCEFCRRNGHTAASCWFGASNGTSSSQQQQKASSLNKDRGARPLQDGRVLPTSGNGRRN